MRTNAIARRLEQLSDQWQAFADNAEARILCWLFGHPLPDNANARRRHLAAAPHRAIDLLNVTF
jgi:hypothetical protein